MLCSGRILAVSHPPPAFTLSRSRRFLRSMLTSDLNGDARRRTPISPLLPRLLTPVRHREKIPAGPEAVQDFAAMELQEIQDNIRSRRNKIFLQMEEVRRLRIQERLKRAELGVSTEEQENEFPNFPSFIPFLPPLNLTNLKQYYASCFALITGIILFGGLLAPTLELKLGLGGTSHADFIRSMHLPMQLSQVDPIVASFSGGAVGVISALMVVEMNNVKQQEDKKCKYCLGTGYLACAHCSGTGLLVLAEPVSALSGGDTPISQPKTERCSKCSGSGKVMCPTCLCTGMAMASEHDPRIDPFD